MSPRLHKSVKWTLLLILAITFGRFLGLGRWQTENVIASDGLAYYAYLPAAFVHGDLSFRFCKDLPPEHRKKYWVYPQPNGKALPKMTIGTALLQLPFFLVAHGYSHAFGQGGAGYSWPYQLAIGLSAIAALFIGLAALGRILSKWFSPIVVVLTVIMICFATNLYYYAVYEGSMSHVYSFCLVSLFLERYLAFRREKGYKTALLLGLLAGLVILVRPTNCVLLIIPFMLQLLDGGFRGLLKDWKFYACAGMLSVMPIFLQMSLWKSVTGSWVYYSYGDEGFFFGNPQILKGLFSYRNGWFVYAPVMLFILPGLVFFYRASKHLALAIGLLLVALVYITFSWWTWFYGDSFGIRPMVDFYAVFALPLAAFLAWGLKGKLKPVIVPLLCIGMVLLNLGQTRLYALGVIDGSSMTKEAYWASFGRCEIPKSWWERGLLNEPDVDNLIKGLPERERDTIQLAWIGELKPIDRNNPQISGALEISGAEFMEASENPFVSVDARVRISDVSETELFLILDFKRDNETYAYYGYDLSVENPHDDKWFSAGFEKPRPKGMKGTDVVWAYLWKTRGPEADFEYLRLGVGEWLWKKYP